jgi:hypothetical protein
MSYKYIKDYIPDSVLFPMYKNIVKVLETEFINEEKIKEFFGKTKDEKHYIRTLLIDELLCEMEKRGYNKEMIDGNE